MNGWQEPKDRESIDMVAVLMRDKHRVQRIGIHTDALQCRADRAAILSHIDQNFGLRRFYVSTVAPGAGKQSTDAVACHITYQDDPRKWGQAA